MKDKIKNYFKKNKDEISETYKNYAVTNIIVAIFTIILFFFINNKDLAEESMYKIFVSGLLMSTGSFAIETIAKNIKKERKIITIAISEIVNIILSIAMGRLINDNGLLNVAEKLSICYGISSFLVAIFYVIRQNKIELAEYTLKALSSTFKTLIIYGILALGILVIILILNILLIDSDNSYIYIEKIEELLIGFYLIPQLINSITNMNISVGKFGKNLVKYVLMPIIIITFLIVYIYMIKIIIVRNMPKNQVFMILSVLFTGGAIIWTSMQHIKDESIMYKISMKLPIFYIPFVILQIYSMTLRVNQLGVTPARYLGYMLVAFEVAYILLYILKKEKIHNIIIAGIIITITSVLIPKVNMLDVSVASQINILKKYKEIENYTAEDSKKARGAYYYLIDTEKGKEYIDKNLNNTQIEAIKHTEKNIKNNLHYTYSSNESTVNMNGYNKFTPVRADEYLYSSYDGYGEGNSNKSLQKEFSSINFEDDNGAIKISKVNIYERINEFIENYNEISNNQNYNFEIELNENQKIIITSVKINIYDDYVESYYIYGYLIEK